MHLNSLISNIHWIPVIVMTVFSFVVGLLWHSKFLFGKPWKEENYPNNMPVEINAPLVFGGTGVVHFIIFSALSAIVSGLGAMNGLIGGLLISLVWVFPALAGTYLFANRSLRLLFIDAGMYIVLFSLSGLILGIW
ncbi:MAG: DUF1761 domain-containing protein [Paludibacteraceae bacterium]